MSTLIQLWIKDMSKNSGLQQAQASNRLTWAHTTDSPTTKVALLKLVMVFSLYYWLTNQWKLFSYFTTKTDRYFLQEGYSESTVGTRDGQLPSQSWSSSHFQWAESSLHVASLPQLNHSLMSPQFHLKKIFLTSPTSICFRKKFLSSLISLHLSFLKSFLPSPEFFCQFSSIHLTSKFFQAVLLWPQNFWVGGGIFSSPNSFSHSFPWYFT